MDLYTILSWSHL